MKKIIALVLLYFIVANSVSAQKKLKYKDVIDDMPNVKSEISYMRFEEHRRVAPDFPNVYFQMGLINWKWLKDVDPFLKFDRAKQLIYDTKLFLGVNVGYLAKDDKEVKRNKDLYSNYEIIGDMSQLDQQDVAQYINKTIANVNEYEENVNKILGFYYKTVEKYNKCIEIYKTIVSLQYNFKNLLMDNDDNFKQLALNLSQNFDSVTYYFDEYKTAIASYPIKNYNQKLTLIPIETYRLDGLTHSDFLQPNINIWDYRTWVSEVLNTQNGDISNIKKEAIAYINNTRNSFNKIDEENIFTDQISEYKENNILINKIEKYDYNSIMSACIKYETDINNLKLACLRSNNCISDSTLDNYSNKIAYYYDLFLHKNNAYNSLLVVNDRINDMNCKKLSDFLNNLYNSTDYFKSSFFKDENDKINSIEKSYLNNMKKSIVNIFNTTNQKTTWQKAEIPLSISNDKFNDVKIGSYVTLFSTTNNSGYKIACGYHKTSANNSAGFVLKMKNNNEVEWLKNVSLSANGQNYITQITSCEDGGYIVNLLSVDATGNKTFAIKFDVNGKQIAKIDYQCPLIPVSMVYDDLNEQIFTVFKGYKLNENSGNEDVCVQTIDFQTKTSSNKAKFSLDGNIAGIIKVPNEIITICNYQSLKSENDSIDLNSTNYDIAMISISDKINAYPIKYNKPICAVYPAKIDANTFCIPAIINQNNKNNLLESDEMIYTIFNNKGQMIYNSDISK